MKNTDIESPKNDEYFKKRTKREWMLIFWYILTGIFKTLVFNLKYFGIRGMIFPVLISGKAKFTRLSGAVEIDSAIWKTGMIKLGFPAPETFDNHNLSFV